MMDNIIDATTWDGDNNELTANVAKLLADDFLHNARQGSIAYKILPPDESKNHTTVKFDDLTQEEQKHYLKTACTGARHTNFLRS